MTTPTPLKRFQLLFLLMGDIAVFVLSLRASLWIRYSYPLSPEIWEIHRIPYFFVLLIFLFCISLGDLYNFRHRSLSLFLLQKILVVFLLWMLLTFSFFYFSPWFVITPKLFLLLHTSLLLSGFLFYRWLLLRFVSPGPLRWAFIGSPKQIQELLSVKGYQLQFYVAALTGEKFPLLRIPPEALSVTHFKQYGIERVVIADELLQDQFSDFFFKELIPRKIRIQKLPDFYEELLQKVPVQSISTQWFLENLDESKFALYDRLKRLGDILGVVIFTLPAALVATIVMVALLIEGKTSILYSQKRVHQGGGLFTMYKFASMAPDAEKNGPQWSGTHDLRVTQVGKMIRKLHFDEIPQLYNILRGEMSFIGPRPERPEFVEMLQKEIPFYYQRFLVKPGLSGWAQMNYPYGSDVKDALEKLQYELFYIKNRSILFELEIFLRSLRLFLFSPEKSNAIVPSASSYSLFSSMNELFKKNGLSVVLGLIVIFLLLSSYKFRNVRPDSDTYQAVFLTNSQVYFGKLAVYKSQYALSDVYYIQGNTDPRVANKNIKLIKFGEELHGPKDQIVFERNQVLFWQDMKTDSVIMKGIQEYKEKGPTPAVVTPPVEPAPATAPATNAPAKKK